MVITLNNVLKLALPYLENKGFQFNLIIFQIAFLEKSYSRSFPAY